MNASVANMSEYERISMIVRFSLYTLEGPFLIFLNFAMLIAILRQPVLRSQYAVLCGLLFTDGLTGCATLSAGIGRNAVLLSDTYNDLVSRRACMFKVWNLLFIWTNSMTAIMLLIVSVDRLFAVCLPIRYFNNSTKFARWQLVISHLFMLCSVIVGWILAYPETEPLYSKICWSYNGINSSYYIYDWWLRIVAALLSVVLYGMVVMRMWSQAKKVATSIRTLNNSSSRFTKRQMRLTVSMGISCMCTCVFYVIPIGIELYVKVTGMASDSLSFFSAFALIISNLNSISNFLVMFHRHADIRRATFMLLTCGKYVSVTPASQNFQLAQKSSHLPPRPKFLSSK